MDIITQNTYEVLELVEAGQISAEEVDYLISEGSINPYLFESVLDELIAENEYVYEATSAEKLLNKHVLLKQTSDPEKRQELLKGIANDTHGNADLQKLNNYAFQTYHKGGSHQDNIEHFRKMASIKDKYNMDPNNKDNVLVDGKSALMHGKSEKEAYADWAKNNIKHEEMKEPEHAKGFVDHIIDAYHKGAEHVKQAYESAKETVKEHPGVAAGAAGAAAAGAAGYAAYKYLKNKKAKAGK